MAVTLNDIAARLGVATPDSNSPQGKQWVTWIGDAEALIDIRAAALGVDRATLNPELVDRVVALAVVAMARKPDDSTTLDVAIDDGRVSRRWETSTGQVGILDDWWGWLGLVGDGALGSFQMYGEPDRHPLDPWVTLP